MELIKYLGEIIAIETNISVPAARGMLKLAIKDEFGPFIPLKELNLKNYISVIQNSLKKRLLDLEIKKSTELVTFLLEELNRNQSLLTIGKV